MTRLKTFRRLPNGGSRTGCLRCFVWAHLAVSQIEFQGPHLLGPAKAIKHRTPPNGEGPIPERIIIIVAMEIAKGLHEGVLSQGFRVLPFFRVAIDRIE